MREAKQISEALEGCTILLPVDRRSAEFATALQRHGASTIIAPPLTITPHFDDAELLHETRLLLETPPDIVVVTTGVGFRGWMDAAEQDGIQVDLISSLRRPQILVRGPKARGAVQQAGLEIDWVAETETSAEITEYLLAEGVRGKRIVIQHHGEGDPEMESTLVAAGAEVQGLTIYRWGAPPDPDLVGRTTGMVAAGNVDAVLFTSAPGARAWLRFAEQLGTLPAIQQLSGERTIFGAVGPITAVPLEAAGLSPAIPERFRLGALVRETVLLMAGPHTATATPYGPLHVRTGGILLDGRFHPLGRTGSNLLRILAARPGRVLSREEISKELSSGITGGHADGWSDEQTTERAVEVTVARIRSALAEPDLIQTVYKRGYRLAVADVPE
ncbi:MAG: uroporphyrinogen-III synthase [Corynebacterium sp.]|uniref:uroporphyrinogen-III synthase n=1 Tax=unclassified Corynebacterium TaxID=2624378 RepID=UPI0026481309|nr:uroporphyrinogen-III synthase [Corynebacterium sp.]MDN5719266.1 uroporphyrinogen-III synthase [Corynebacterium sp.]MDN6324045.1 uroporphyrinogen-III synthase [Corynebacterium sp.]MDN6386144.1 uroporphyrinogen-III synthase [Corynebacterium sp.]MDN6509141.1 uroporphyrinogen-III synthase [Corynebacterium sp.]